MTRTAPSRSAASGIPPTPTSTSTSTKRISTFFAAAKKKVVAAVAR